MFKEDLDLVVLAGFIICGIVSVVSLVLGIIYLVRGLRIRKTIYKCEFCLHKFSTPLIVERHTRPYADLLRSIRKNSRKEV